MEVEKRHCHTPSLTLFFSLSWLHLLPLCLQQSSLGLKYTGRNPDLPCSACSVLCQLAVMCSAASEGRGGLLLCCLCVSVCVCVCVLGMHDNCFLPLIQMTDNFLLLITDTDTDTLNESLSILNENWHHQGTKNILVILITVFTIAQCSPFLFPSVPSHCTRIQRKFQGVFQYFSNSVLCL